jgi:D-alanyl-D-alanine carboxypeptidase
VKLIDLMNIRALLMISLFFVSPSISKIYAQQKEDMYQKILDEAANNGLPAVVALVQSTNKEVWKGKAGVSNVENSELLSIEQSFRLASVTKIFTSIVVLQLVDENKISLTDTISMYFDEETKGKLPNVDKITILQLLSHSSGIYSFTENNSFWKECFNNGGMSRVWAPSELISYIENKKPASQPTDPFAEKYYSNTNYILLGMIIEKVTSNRLSVEYQKRIFTPLGMNNTFLEGYDDQRRKPIDSYVIPHSLLLKSAVNKNGIEKITKSGLINLSNEYDLFNSWAWAAGGISSNVTDLSSFLSALKNSDMLSDDSQKILVKLNSSEDNGITFFGGTGGSDGIQSTMLHMMPSDIVIIILINSTGQKQVNLSSVFIELYKAAKSE